MATKTGKPTIVLKVTVAPTNTNVAFTNGGLPITTLSAGKWLVSYNMALKPVTGGGALDAHNCVFSTVAPYGVNGYISQIGHIGCFLQGEAIAKLRDCISGFISLSVASPIYMYLLSVVTIAGTQWQTVTAGVAPDTNGNTITFIKIE